MHSSFRRATSRALAAFAAAALLVGVPAAGALAGDLKSGPEVGKTIPGPFHPLNVTGAKAGEKHCLV